MKNKQLVFLTLMGLLFRLAYKKYQVCSYNLNAVGYSETLNYTYNETKKKAKDACNTYERKINFKL
jgi:hypothetical protein